MIPKIIHYVWLGGGDLTPSVKRCIKSWQKAMPDYEIKCWSEKNFDINSVTWVKEAIEKKKWSLASDFIRHYAIYTEGGIYMDTDVVTYKPFDEFLGHSFFTSVEWHPVFYDKSLLNEDGTPKEEGAVIPGLGLLAATFGAEKGNPFIKECLDYFGCRHFIQPDGSLYTDIINPGIMATIAVKYGFRYIDKDQILDKNMKVYSSSVFAGDESTRSKESYSMHFADGTWREKTIRTKIKDYIVGHIPLFFKR